MPKFLYPPSQKTTCMHVDECEEKTASGDVTKWTSHKHSRGITLDIEDVKGKFRYHGLARGVFHNRRAQNFLEYAMLIIVISAALIAMYQYIQRAMNARLRQVQVELDESKR